MISSGKILGKNIRENCLRELSLISYRADFLRAMWWQEEKHLNQKLAVRKQFIIPIYSHPALYYCISGSAPHDDSKIKLDMAVFDFATIRSGLLL